VLRLKKPLVPQYIVYFASIAAGVQTHNLKTQEGKTNRQIRKTKYTTSFSVKIPPQAEYVRLTVKQMAALTTARRTFPDDAEILNKAGLYTGTLHITLNLTLILIP